ncbi:MAG: UDP-N-acetylmuramate--alanine ligase [Candidatus Latescibacterota bacterium]
MKTLVERFSSVHLVGIGGVGMEGLARLLRALGIHVTGSDMSSSRALSLLREDGFEVFAGHVAAQIGTADLLVYSAAIPADNVEVVTARKLGIPCVNRGELLGELSRSRYTLAVAGTHGKTTSAAMLAAILSSSGREPDVLVGGWIAGRAQAEIGRGQMLVVEADEFSRSFLALYPDMAIVTCVDAEHLDCYGSLHEIEQTFVQFIDRLPFYGIALVGGDGLVGNAVRKGAERNCKTFGLGEDCDYRIENVQEYEWSSRFTLSAAGQVLGEIELRVPGLHNVRNAAGAAAMALEIEVEFADISAALAAFTSVDRRFQLKGEVDDICVVDDYAHHPAELAAVLATARTSGRRVIAVFQPHLYSRTRDFAGDFARELTRADRVVLTEIYPAREAPLPGVNGRMIEKALRESGYTEVEFVEKVGDLAQYLGRQCRSGDMVLTMGAGDIGEVADELVGVLRGDRR